MKIGIHIGFPKCFSTSIQRSLFIKHPQIYYLGAGHNNNNIDYISKRIENLFEYHLRYSKRIHFQKKLKELKKLVKKYESIAKKKGKKILVISNEILCIKLTPHDIDPYEKARRLKLLFGSKSKIIIIIKNQKHQIISMYKEAVKLGYPNKFNAYVDFLIKTRFNFYLGDFFYDNTYEIYSEFFSKGNIKIIQFEDFLNDKNLILNQNLSNEIFKFLKLINKTKIKIGFYNKSIEEKVLEKKRKLNKKYRHDISNISFDFIEGHRIKNYFSSELKMDHVYKNPFRDVKLKRHLIKIAKKQIKKDSKKINLNFSKANTKKLSKIFKSSNKKLEKIANIKLCNKYFF